MFPSQNWIKWYYSFLEGLKEIGKFLPDPSATTYSYTHSLFMCFTGDLLHHPTKVKVEAQIVDQTFPCLQSVVTSVVTKVFKYLNNCNNKYQTCNLLPSFVAACIGDSHPKFPHHNSLVKLLCQELQAQTCPTQMHQIWIFWITSSYIHHRVIIN